MAEVEIECRTSDQRIGSKEHQKIRPLRAGTLSSKFRTSAASLLPPCFQIRLNVGSTSRGRRQSGLFNFRTPSDIKSLHGLRGRKHRLTSNTVQCIGLAVKGATKRRCKSIGDVA
jgi:hypothetical protein